MGLKNLGLTATCRQVREESEMIFKINLFNLYEKRSSKCSLLISEPKYRRYKSLSFFFRSQFDSNHTGVLKKLLLLGDISPLQHPSLCEMSLRQLLSQHTGLKQLDILILDMAIIL
jgi:hypothetical protein